MALPLHCNRIAVTVQSRCRYGAIALPLRCNGDAIWLLSQKKLAEKPPTAWSRGRRLPFSRSKCTGFQVLNFGNNILQFTMLCRFSVEHGLNGLNTRRWHIREIRNIRVRLNHNDDNGHSGGGQKNNICQYLFPLGALRPCLRERPRVS